MRIAVVDDDSVMVSLVSRLFPGHDIAAFSGAKPVLEIVMAGERFDVIVTDLIMPAMSGTELHEALSAIDPEQAKRMIFITGGHPPDLDGVLTLQKPFSHTMLRELVEQVGSGESPR